MTSSEGAEAGRKGTEDGEAERGRTVPCGTNAGYGAMFGG